VCRLGLLLLALVLWLPISDARAHDPSAYGGLFRSRNFGTTWLNADIGLFLNAVLALAVDPRDPNHLLMGTDTGLMASTNGGRSWLPEAPGFIVGAVFAVAFAPDGRSILCASPAGVFRFTGSAWAKAVAPEDATPTRRIAFAGSAERIYLLGRDRLFASRDGGLDFSRVDAQLPDAAHMTALAVATVPAETLAAVVDGRLMTSPDGGKLWHPGAVDAPAGSEPAPADTVVADPAVPGRFWAALHDHIYLSDDLGRRWRALSGALPEADTNVRGIAADAAATWLVVTTHRGMYRSENGGRTWGFMEGRLPVHIEAGPLVRDPTDARTLYAAYSLMPYPEVWRAAIEGSNLLAKLDFVSIAGAIAFVLFVFVCGGMLAYWLAGLRAARPAAAPPGRYGSTPTRSVP
jgi:photosystem II stability/assembly factor-like uncharacterized protein